MGPSLVESSSSNIDQSETSIMSQFKNYNVQAVVPGKYYHFGILKGI